MRTRNTTCIALAASGIALAALAPRAGAEHGGSDSEAVQLLRHLAGEVRKLRQDVLDLHLETQEARTPQLEHDLLLVQTEQQRLEQQMHVHHQEIVSVERQLAQPGLPPDEMQELIARKAELAVDVNQQLRNRKSSLAQQETAARERLDRQLQRVRAVLANSSELRPR